MCQNRAIDRVPEQRPFWVVGRMHNQKTANNHPKGRAMTTATALRPIVVTLPDSLTGDWGALDGVQVDGATLTINPSDYFFRYDNPSWLVCDWSKVRADLLGEVETPDVALEQTVLDYVREHGRSTTDPTEVLRIAWDVYAYLFSEDRLTEPDLADVDRRHLRILHEMGTVMALNRVELDGTISNAGPAWLFGDTARIVFDLTEDETMALDELYHGGFFNESRRVASIKAHAALGGRLVHGCQSVPNQSGGVVAPYGCDIDRFHAELKNTKDAWRVRIAGQAAS
jgi:hypothetical protein